MFDKYLSKENLKPEHLQKAYEYLKEYADENNTTIKKILADDNNIPTAAQYIHAKLPWMARKMLNQEKIVDLISKNFDFIKEQALNFEKEHNPIKTVAKEEKVKKSKKA